MSSLPLVLVFGQISQELHWIVAIIIVICCRTRKGGHSQNVQTRSGNTVHATVIAQNASLPLVFEFARVAKRGAFFGLHVNLERRGNVAGGTINISVGSQTAAQPFVIGSFARVLWGSFNGQFITLAVLIGINHQDGVVGVRWMSIYFPINFDSPMPIVPGESIVGSYECDLVGIAINSQSCTGAVRYAIDGIVLSQNPPVPFIAQINSKIGILGLVVLNLQQRRLVIGEVQLEHLLGIGRDAVNGRLVLIDTRPVPLPLLHHVLSGQGNERNNVGFIMFAWQLLSSSSSPPKGIHVDSQNGIGPSGNGVHVTIAKNAT
mmetsp:Transcript_8619/g.18672  ORF Transcript_8619/g.18672 Transcript_8619/m.18672 type:complete len:319 (+) Transcript_8619:165-1121(+)